ncbi:pilin [Undibacterium sp.]|jgi:type IV pilus assembly protein PilA|uniref:pilin n=1 Tax=Undibacterium sp. TaxID=1914977 RepID=UPI002C806904|nr:pilin [Undibacterium sp.]HTD02298.1 pilin [Undibacterium sp.]
MNIKRRTRSLQVVQTMQKGFTLIEVMIVVAIVAILCAYAIPVYSDFVQRSQVAEAFTVAEGMKTAISEFAQTNGIYPTATDISAGVGAGVTGKYSSAVTTATTGVIIVTMNNAGVGADVQGKKITFTPPPAIAGTPAFPFTCTSDAKQKYLPASCSGT